jgi:hypothetical protein
MTSGDAFKEDYMSSLSRVRELQLALDRLEEVEARLLDEMGKVDQQLAYYASLTRDMKASVAPPRLNRLMRSLRRS